ncbi:MAG: hypothetical protein ACRDQI_02565 [Pseudonocardiaceae bacterium]
MQPTVPARSPGPPLTVRVSRWRAYCPFPGIDQQFSAVAGGLVDERECLGVAGQGREEGGIG